MPRRREMDVFSWSFLDAITCGFGAVVLTFVIISAQVSSNAGDASATCAAETTKWEDEVLDARKNLVRLKNAMQVDDEQQRYLAAEQKRLEDLLAKLRAELKTDEGQTVARKESVEQLRADIQQLEEANRRLEARAAEESPNTGQRVRSFVGQGNRQYLTGIRMGGERVLILVDASTSMLARTYVNVVRFRAMPDDRKVRAPKWQQTIRTVDWLTTQIKPGTKVQIYVFNETAHSVVDGTDGRWLDVQDGTELNRAIAALRKVVPQNGNSLINAFEALKALNPQPDNVFLITDGLPTLGKSHHPRSGMSNRRSASITFSRPRSSATEEYPLNVMLLPMDGRPRRRRLLVGPSIRVRGLTTDSIAGLAMRRRKRRSNEIFSLYFLDGMCCAFGAVIMLLLITKAAEPRIIEQAQVRTSAA